VKISICQQLEWLSGLLHLLEFRIFSLSSSRKLHWKFAKAAALELDEMLQLKRNIRFPGGDCALMNYSSRTLLNQVSLITAKYF
jgi:hypothetical protein